VCERRIARADRCPRCGADAIRDLRSADDRARVWRALERPALATIIWPSAALVLGGLVLWPALLAALVAIAAGGGGGAMIMLLLFVVPLALGRSLAHRSSASPEDRSPAGILPLIPLPPTLGPGEPLRTARGRVHVLRAVVSPSGTSCAAWQGVGVGPGGPIDDAGIGVFEVWDGGRAVAIVDIPDALVDVGPLADPVAVTVAGAVADWLRVRGPLPYGARCSLAEGVLLDGDHVEVIGRATDTAAGDGLRTMHEVLVFQSWATIRRPPVA
jgi:hypothetical protein